MRNMLNIRYISMLALGATLVLGACGGETAEEIPEEETIDLGAPVETTPSVTEGAVIMDTSMVGTPATNPPIDTAAADTAR